MRRTTVPHLGMNIETIEVGEFQVNCFVVWDSATLQALVIDPGGNAESILSFLRKKRLSVAACLLTHGHFDHIGALKDVNQAFPSPIAIHPADLAWAFTEANQFPPFYPPVTKPAAEIRALKDGQIWTDGGLSYAVIETPGHSPGSVCFHFKADAALFSGDTLFAGSVGRTDLPGGHSRSLTVSLKKLARLPDDTRVFPGHGPATDIAQEKETNYFMQMAG